MGTLSAAVGLVWGHSTEVFLYKKQVSIAAICAVVDPRLDMVEDILELVAAKGMRVTAVIETHLHADHLSGHELDRTRPLAVMCASGQRSMIASALLQRHGFTAVANVVGGMDAWNKVEWKQAEREGDKAKSATSIVFIVSTE